MGKRWCFAKRHGWQAHGSGLQWFWFVPEEEEEEEEEEGGGGEEEDEEDDVDERVSSAVACSLVLDSLSLSLSLLVLLFLLQTCWPLSLCVQQEQWRRAATVK